MEQPDKEQPNIPRGAESKEAPKQKVAYVDDQQEYAEEAWMLEMEAKKSPVKNNFEVVYFSMFKSPESAAEEIIKSNPDVVIMDNDLGMSERPDSGFTGASIVRELRAKGFTGIIVGNSSGGSYPFEKQDVAEMMNSFLPGKNLGVHDFLKSLMEKQQS